MSRESYIRGFCKVAEAAGVDPKALAKFAADNDMVYNPATGRYARPDRSAEIGQWRDNNPDYRYSGSYQGQLSKNTWQDRVKWDDKIKDLVAGFNDKKLKDAFNSVHDFEDYSSHEDDVTLGELEKIRKEQAEGLARGFHVTGSAPWKKVVDNLIQAGRKNYRSYINTGKLPDWSTPDTKGVEKLDLPSKDLLNAQKQMVHNNVTRHNNIA